MAERIPLIYNPSANQIQETGLTDETSVGILTATVFSNLRVVSSPISLANSSFNYLMAGPVSLSDEVSVGVLSARSFSTPNLIENGAVSLANSSFNYGMFGPITVGTSGTIFVGAGVSFTIF